jgi:23S rRNA (guanosine2251-2'-O)-methyltransferase
LGQTIVVIEQPLTREKEIDDDNLPINSDICVLLDNIRSALNVGSIFRSADGFGFHHIYLCGVTPTPESAEVCKSAVGAEQLVKWSAHKNAFELIEFLKGQDYKIWAMEKTQNSTPIHSAMSAGEKLNHLVLVVGNEVSGVDPGILDISDCVVYLPMRGHKRSFNVAVAFAVAAQIIQSLPQSNN